MIIMQIIRFNFNKIFFFFIFCILILPNELLSQNSEITKRLTGLDEFIETAMKDWDIPGLAVAIVKEDKIIYSKGFGYRDIKNNLKVTNRTLFPIASCTKAFTATALGILSDEGRFNWDHPVREYIPFFKLKNDYIAANITTRDMVTHRTGLARHSYMGWHTLFTRKELLEKLQYLEFNRGFRESYEYNNLMYMAAGCVVEGITGKTWEEFLKARIFEPLEMTETNFSIDEMKKSADFSHPYIKRDEGVFEHFYWDVEFIGPAASINSNVSEMANWIIMNLNDGSFKGKQIISKEKLEEIMTPQVVASKIISDEEMFYKLYAMGWGINSYRGHLMAIHFGSLDGAKSLVSMLPKEKIGIVVLTNISYSPIREIIAYNIYDRLLGLEPINWNKKNLDKIAINNKGTEKPSLDTNRKINTTPSHLIENYTGNYENDAYGKITVSLGNNKLKIIYNDISALLQHYHYDVFQPETSFYFENMKFNFLMDKKGDIDRIAIPLEPSVKEIIFTRCKP